jgi:hypothetical protein
MAGRAFRLLLVAAVIIAAVFVAVVVSQTVMNPL